MFVELDHSRANHSWCLRPSRHASQMHTAPEKWPAISVPGSSRGRSIASTLVPPPPPPDAGEVEEELKIAAAPRMTPVEGQAREEEEEDE